MSVVAICGDMSPKAGVGLDGNCQFKQRKGGSPSYRRIKQMCPVQGSFVYGPPVSGWAFHYYQDFIHVQGGSVPIRESQAGP
jgi:hypothetical protein